MKLKTTVIAGLAGVAMMSAAPAFAESKTLNDVKSRGILQCVVNPGLAGFASPDDKGVWQGFDIDRQLAHGLRGVRVEKHPAFSAQAADALDVLNDTGFVVDVHD